MKVFDSVPELLPLRIWEGAVARAVVGERLTVALVELEPDVAVPVHQHENEQVGFVMEGSIIMQVGEDKRELGPGGTYVILGGTPHLAIAGPQGCTVVDVFAPPRNDWESAERLPARPGKWPQT